MNWWMGVLIFVGMIIVGALLGFLASYIILRVKKKPWPYSWPTLGNRNNGHTVSLEPNVPVFQMNKAVTENKMKSSAEMQEALEEFVKKRQANPVASESLKLQKSEFLLEVEANLAIATSPWTGKLIPFQTKSMDANRSRVDALLPELKELLTEAYTDMRLANTLVWLSMDVGHRSKDLDESYLKLCNKISERLEKVLTPLTRAGI